MNPFSTLLIIPPNDAEAILIAKLAEAMKLSLLKSKQIHGASLDKGKDVVLVVKKGKYKTVIVVEMPGVKTEAKLRKFGIELIIIDHHHYTNLNRAQNPKTGKLLPSSLEQFLKLFHLTDTKIKVLGFDSRLVKAIGIMDRGYVWALKDEGYSKEEIKSVLKFHDELIAPLINPKTEAKKNTATDYAWKSKKKWNGYFIVETKADVQLRPRLSRLIVTKIGKPTSLIIIEYKRKLIYVQESKRAKKLFTAFGGFTFGQDHNWGYKNEKGKIHIGLDDVKRILL